MVSCAWFCFSLQSHESTAAVHFLFCKCDMSSVCEEFVLKVGVFVAKLARAAFTRLGGWPANRGAVGVGFHGYPSEITEVQLNPL